MSDETALIFDKTPYLCTSKYLFDQFLLFGFDKNEKKKNVYDTLVKSIIDKHKNSKTVINSSENCCIIPGYLSLLYSISSRADELFMSPDLISSIIFPNGIKIHYQIGEVVYKFFNVHSNKKIVFIMNNDTTDGNSKNISNGFAFISYEMFKSTIQLPTESSNEQVLWLYIPKVICIISHFPFFAHYSHLSQHILDLFSMRDLEIPIEILLYNLINFTPAPIGINVKISLFTTEGSSKVSNLKISKDDTDVIDTHKAQDLNKIDQSLYFSCLSGYPLCDFNLSELFSIIPLEHIIEILIFTFLEIDMLVFSKDLEVLNLVLYMFSILNYPVNDSPYFWHVLSVTKDALKKGTDDGSSFIGKPFTTMIGINCTYDTSLNLSKFATSLFIVDIDNSEFLFKSTEDRLEEEDYEDYQQILNFHEYIEKVIISQDQGKNEFEYNLIKFVEEIGWISNKAEISKSNDKTDYYNFYHDIDYKFNIRIQEAFYTFILNILRMNSKSKNIIHKKDLKSIIEEEMIFSYLFQNSSRHNLYYKNFMSKHKTLDFFRISLYFSEEFIQLNNTNAEEYAFQHFAIINDFYTSNTKTECIDFNNFYSYYVNQINHIIYDEVKRDNLVSCKKKTIKKQNRKINKYLYTYNRTELYDNIVFNYMYLLSNLDEDQINTIFPFSSLITNTSIDKVTYSEIADQIESFYLKNKAFNQIDIISFSIILFYSFTIIFMDQNEFTKQFCCIYDMLLKQTLFCRKYLTMVISIFYNHMLMLKKKGIEYEYILNAYKDLKQLIKVKKVVYNEKLNKVIKVFDTFLEDGSSDITLISVDSSNDSLIKSDKSSCIDFSINCTSSWIKNTPNPESEFTVFLDDNKCEHDTFSEDFIMTISGNVEYEGDIKIDCDICLNKITPIIKVQLLNNNNNKELIKSNIFSPLKIYLLCTNLFKNWLLSGMISNAFDKKVLKNIMINLLFYQKIIPDLSLHGLLIPITELINYNK